MIAPATSIYRWDGEVKRDEEVLLFIKTTAAGVGPLKARILELHPYEIPEFLAFEVGVGSAGYLAWVMDSVVTAGPDETES